MDLLPLPFYDVDSQEWSSPHCCSRRREILNQRTIVIFKDLRRGRRKRQGNNSKHDLSHLLNLSIDIIYEVLGHLHPLDLYNLTRTTKQSRAYLISKKSLWLWALVFERNPSIPSCPPDLPHPAWAELLFGPLACQSCNDPWTDPADSPTFRRRLCWVCTRKLSETLDPWPFDRSSSPNSVLVTTTSNSPDFRVICPPSRDNIQRMADQIEITVSLSSDSWESDLEEFETNPATKNIAIPIIFHGTISRAWAAELDGDEFLASTKMREKTLKMLQHRFARMGCNPCDVATLYDSSFFETYNLDHNKPVKSIRRNWWRLKGLLEAKIRSIARSRHWLERNNIVTARKHILKQLFNAYLPTISDETLDAPLGTELALYEPFFSLVDEPSEEPLEKDGIEDKISLFLQRWPPRTMEELIAACPTLQSPTTQQISPLANPNAAISVFSCVACVKEIGPSAPGQCLIGWDAARMHYIVCHRSLSLRTLQINERGCVAAVSLLGISTLDSLIVLPEDMDGLGGAFVCLNCPKTHGTRSMFVWRDCISHYINATHASPSWRSIAASAEWTDMRARQDKDESFSFAYAADFPF